jgi:hypothetical protein
LLLFLPCLLLPFFTFSRLCLCVFGEWKGNCVDVDVVVLG